MIASPRGGLENSASATDDEQIARDALMELMRHLVCLGFLVRKRLVKNATCFFRSGFIMEVENQWFWTTAGHVLEDIQKDGFQHPDQFADEFRLIDSFGTGAIDKHYVPFDFERAWKYFEHDDDMGLDYGVVALGELEKLSLQKNNIMPVRVPDWQESTSDAFRDLFVMGFPSDLIAPVYGTIQGGFSIRGVPTPSAVYMERIAPTQPQKPCPRLYGKLSESYTDPKIDGMSGGPVFVLPDDGSKCEIIAVQSGWMPDQTITFACPLKVFGPRLLKAINER